MDRPDSPASGSGASPLKAFLVILALIILTTVIFLMAANGEEPPDATPQSNAPPDFSLTDEEAIARFEELYAMSLAIYEERDVSLLPLVYLSGSSIYSDVQKEVTGLRRDGVVTEMNARIESVEVESNLETEIRIKQIVTLSVRFRDEKGKDITIGGGDEIQTIEWLLKLDQSKWLISSATIVDAKRVDKGDQ